MSEETESNTLTDLEETLLELANENKSVLIYGKDTIDRYNLIRKVHLVKRGKVDSFEKMEAKLKDIIRDRNLGALYELLRDFRSTDNTYSYFDFNSVDANTFLTTMRDYTFFKQDEAIDKISSMIKRKEHWEDFCIDLLDYDDDIDQQLSSTTSYRKARLLSRKGTLFVNNLRCNTSNSEIYEKLTTQIEKDRGHPLQKRWSVGDKGWFVVYTLDNPKAFPKYFREQFEPVPLDDSEAKQQNKENNKAEAVIETLKDGAGERARNIEGIIKKRGRKPKHSKHGEFMEILNDILEYGEDISLGKYVKKVQAEMEKKGLKEKKKNIIAGQEEGLIYTDTTIRTYIQKHPKYNIIQKKREEHKKA
jgi:hypothetical protein